MMTDADRLRELIRTCRICGANLHAVAIAGDEWAYADEDGRCYVSSGLADRVDMLRTWLDEVHRTGQQAPDWLAQEYSLLSCQLTLGMGTGHEHLPKMDPTGVEFNVPEHCGWPGRLRPSGWYCRLCNRSLGLVAENSRTVL